MSTPRSEAAKLVRMAVAANLQQPAAPGPAAGAGAEGAAQDRRVATHSRFNIFINLKTGNRLVYNSFYDSFALWDRDDYETYERVGRGSLHVEDEELAPFVSAGYVVPEGTDEMAELENAYHGSRFATDVMTLTITPTLACNFGCDYCFQGANKPSGGMSEEVQDALIAYVRAKAPGLKRLSIAWYGGEPLMARPAICRLSDRLIEVCKQAKVSYNAFMVTNGYALTREVAQQLADRKVELFQVTLDGPEEYHDTRRNLLSGRPTFGRILDNLREVVDHVKAKISIRVNIDSRNGQQIRELIDDLEERGFAGRANFQMYFAPVEAITEGCHGCNDVTFGKVTYGRLEADLVRYAFEKKLTPLPRPPRFFGNCQAVKPLGLLLSPTGDLHKCWDTVQVPSMRVGTIFEPEKLADDPLYQSWLAWTPFANDVCRNCKILPNCSGSCAYKFVHSEKTLGEAAVLPCPSWKFNLNERLFFRAEALGLVARDAWDPEASPTTPAVVGRNHSIDSVAAGSDGRTRRRADPALSLPVITV